MDLSNDTQHLEDSMLEEEWVPPTEAEMKIINARRERQDKISKIMGQYLLQGYKMLATTCPKCSTILLRTRPSSGHAAEDYCISCSELDSDISKDDPAIDMTAARSQVLEGQARELQAQDLRMAQGDSSAMTRMASGDGASLTASSNVGGQLNTPATEARPSNPEGAVSSGLSMRMGRPDTGATQIESCTALGCLRKIDPPRVSSDESGSRARCAMMVICPSMKLKDQPPSGQGSEQPATGHQNAQTPQVSSSLYHHHHHHHVHQNDFCPIHNSAAPVANRQCNSHGPHPRECARVRESVAAVLDKMEWASEQLKKCVEVEESRRLCGLITSCAEAVSALKAVSSFSVVPEKQAEERP